MLIRNILFIASFVAVSSVLGTTQESLKLRPPKVAEPDLTEPEKTISLTVPQGAALEIALDANFRVKKSGQEIHGRLVRSVYAFDQLVLPAGTAVTGHIAKIEGISRTKHVLGILNGDFTPKRRVEVEFSNIRLADGKDLPLKAMITPGSGQPMQLVSARESQKKKGVQDAAAKKIDEAKQQARQSWEQAMKQVKDPGKLRRLEQYALAQLPVRPQYLHAGTVYFANLEQSLDFGCEPMTPRLISSLGAPPPAGSLVHALLETPLNSATTRKGAEVTAVLSQPLFDGERLVFPEGSRLKGDVVQVRPARRWHHNGQLRIVFRELAPPDGIEQRVVAGLETVQAGTNQHVKLDSEGGAEAASPRTRYVSLALSLALTTAAFRQHTDGDETASGQSDNGVAGGAAGFKLVGMALGIAVKSQPLGMAMGAYGSARAVYTHIIAKGSEVVFPMNTPMEISLGPSHKPVLPAGSPTAERRP